MMLPARVMPILEGIYACITGTRINVIACGTTSTGVVIPLRVDANGQLITVVGS